MSPRPKIDAHTIRKLSVLSFRDPRTVRKVLEGTAAPLADRAVREAAARAGIELPLLETPSDSTPPPRVA
jgi:hypothetical protein